MNSTTVPSVSVCMPCYNDALYLNESVDSILAQSLRDFELLIVDDGSTDDCVRIIQSYKDPRIRLLRNNHDFIGSLNLLLEEARGKYIARMDADDMMLPDRLLIQFNYLETHPDLDILGGGMEYFGSQEGVFLPLVRERRLRLEDFREMNMVAHPTVMIRRDALTRCPLKYEQEYMYAEDYKLWITALQGGLSVDNLRTILLRYRISPKQNSSRFHIRQKAVVKQLQEEIAALTAQSQNTKP